MRILLVEDDKLMARTLALMLTQAGFEHESVESGEEAIGSSWPQFNIRFYVVALMFILFEIELIFLFPHLTDKNLQNNYEQWLYCLAIRRKWV